MAVDNKKGISTWRGGDDQDGMADANEGVSSWRGGEDAEAVAEGVEVPQMIHTKGGEVVDPAVKPQKRRGKQLMKVEENEMTEILEEVLGREGVVVATQAATEAVISEGRRV